ncbi:MAG: hypothetical protein ACLFN5_02420 [bacterium]
MKKSDPFPGARMSALFLLALLFLFSAAFQPLPPEVKDEQIVNFVSKNIPDLKGVVILVDGEDVFVELEKGQLPATVDLLRTVLEGESPDLRAQKVHLARGRLEAAGEGIGRLVLSESLLPYARAGDRVRRRPVVLYLDIGKKSQELGGRLLEIEQIEAIKLGQPGSEAEGTEYLLKIEPGQLRLQHVNGEKVATLSLDAPDERRYRGRLLPEIDTVVSFSGVMRDFLLIDEDRLLVAGENDIRLLDLIDDEAQTVSSQDIQGDLLSLSLLSGGPSSGGGEYLEFLLVYRRRGSVRTAYYRYIPQTYKFERLWEEQNFWVEKTGDKFRALRTGLFDPFAEKLHPVEISPKGWEWDEGDIDLVSRTVPSALNVKDRYFWRISPGGRLEKYLNDELIYRTEEKYGDSPLEIEARQGPRSSILHPSWALYEKEGKNYIFIAHNQSEGAGLFRRFKLFSQSQLYLFEERDRELDKVWESGRLPGYVGALRRHGEKIYFLQVEEENNRTVFYRVDNI